MADLKISELANLTGADPILDMLPIVDVSATPPASGSTKRISINNLLSSSPTASGALTVTGLVTAGSATITGALTVNGGVDMQNATILSFGGLLTITSNTAAGLFIRGRATGGITFQESTGANPLLNISNAGVFTFSDGAGGTRMTLNSTGLGVGAIPSNYRLFVKAPFASGFGGAYIEVGDFNQKSLVVNNTNPGLASNLFEVQKVGTALLTLDASGNLLVGATAAGTSAAKVLAIGTGIEPTTGPAGTVQLFTSTRSASNTIPAIFTEGSGVTNAAITNTTVTNKIAIKVNGTIYYLLATTSAA